MISNNSEWSTMANANALGYMPGWLANPLPGCPQGSPASKVLANLGISIAYCSVKHTHTVCRPYQRHPHRRRILQHCYVVGTGKVFPYRSLHSIYCGLSSPIQYTVCVGLLMGAVFCTYMTPRGGCAQSTFLTSICACAYI